LPEAGDDPMHIRNLIAAQTPDIGGAGELLLERAAIFLRKRGALYQAAADQKHKGQPNLLSSHV
jgi:hypothetical protein